MFDDAKLRTLITALYNDSFLKKACAYKITIDRWGRKISDSYTNPNANVQVAGGVQFDKFIDLFDILSEKNESVDPSYVCLKYGNQLKCKELNVSVNKCTYCDKWVQERNMFRNVINDLINTSSFENKIKLMKDSSFLLPAIILGQTDYHNFKKIYEEFKQSKQTITLR